MNALRFMLIAGEPSGDAIAADLVRALQAHSPSRLDRQPIGFFGAGGSKMKAAGVELMLDLTVHAVFGITDVIRHYRTFRGIFERLLSVACERKPDVIVLVDYGGFNRRFARAIREKTRGPAATSRGWQPKIVYYVSPQVWASRPKRAVQIARDVDLLLSIFPFEKQWYADHAPGLRVEFVGHPMVDRYSEVPRSAARLTGVDPSPADGDSGPHKPFNLLFLPGSRRREIQNHLPILGKTLELVQERAVARGLFVLPTEELANYTRGLWRGPAPLRISLGPLDQHLPETDLAVACSGTVTLECAFFQVPALVIYKTSWLTYAIARQIVQVPFIAMPNLLAGRPVYPEFIQRRARPEFLAREVLELLESPSRRARMRRDLREVADSLGPPGASERAAQQILGLLE